MEVHSLHRIERAKTTGPLVRPHHPPHLLIQSRKLRRHSTTVISDFDYDVSTAFEFVLLRKILDYLFL